MDTVHASHTRAPALTSVAAVWSALTAVLGLWWWVRPEQYPFGWGPANTGSLFALVPAVAVPPALVGAGLVGVGGALLAATGRARGLVVGTAAAWVVVFGFAVPGLQPLTLTGYAMAMFGPVVLFATVLAGAWRRRGGPVAVGGSVLVGVLGWVSGIADGDVVLRYLGVVVATVHLAGPSAIMTFFLGGGLVWGVLGARAVLRARTGRPAWTAPAAAARWGRTATVVAALCALPYGLMRLTWLTPWPLGVDPIDLAAMPEMRLHGLLLGLAALAGALLTTGLVAPWGEVWPRWVLVVRGRPVPLAAAVVPGGVVAALFTVAAAPMIVLMVGAGEWWGLLVFPFPLWGPALGIAVLGYALRRRGEQVPPGTIEGS